MSLDAYDVDAETEWALTTATWTPNSVEWFVAGKTSAITSVYVPVFSVKIKGKVVYRTTAITAAHQSWAELVKAARKHKVRLNFEYTGPTLSLNAVIPLPLPAPAKPAEKAKPRFIDDDK